MSYRGGSGLLDWLAEVTLAGRYRLHDPLDCARWPAVFSAAEGGAAVVIAVVELPPEGPARDLLAERLLATAEATACLRNTGWARVLDAGRVDNEERAAIFVVREPCAGPTLRALLQRERIFPPDRAVQLVHGLLRPLREPPLRRIAHGDLGPDRIWLASPGSGDEVRLSEPAIADCLRTTLRAEQVGGVPIGCLATLAPEQARFEPADARTDIHALGRLLNDLVTGGDPAAAVPAELREVVARCVAVDPEARFPNVRELAQALEQLACFAHRPATGRKLRRRSDVAPLDRSPVVLTIVHHRDERWVGARAELAPGRTSLGREHDPFQGALTDHRVSRTHATLELRGTHLLVTDESRNGTFADGAPAGRAVPTPLSLEGRAPHVLRLGQVVILVRQGLEPTSPSPAASRLLGISAPMERLRGALQRAAASDDPVILVGERGSGRRLAAAELHERSSRRTRSMVTVACAELTGTSLADTLLEAGSLRTALRGRTLLLANLDLAPDEVTAALPEILLAIDRSVVKDRAGAPRWITTVGPRASRLPPRLQGRLATVSLSVPSLAERPEDIALLARRHLNAAGCELVAELAESLLLAEGWPENVRGLFDHLGETFGARAPAGLAPGPQLVVVAPQECRAYAAALIRVLGLYRRVVFWHPEEYGERARSLGRAKVIFVGGAGAAAVAEVDEKPRIAQSGSRWGVVGPRAYVWIDEHEVSDPDAEARELEVELEQVLQRLATADRSTGTADVLPEGRTLAAEFVNGCPLFEPIGRSPVLGRLDAHRVVCDRRHIHTMAAFLHHGIHLLEGRSQG